MPNDLLVKLNIYNFRVKDVPITPVYNIGEVSNLKIGKAVFTLSYLLFKRFIWRMKEKYIIRDFHPLIFFYLLAFFLLTFSLPLIFRLIYIWLKVGAIPQINALGVGFALVAGLQCLFFAMWFDMENNKDLK